MEELLQEIEEEKLTPEPQTQQEEGPSERALWRDECYQMLSGQELNSGSRLGMYIWAVGLGQFWSNVEVDWKDPESIDMLNAYDCF